MDGGLWGRGGQHLSQPSQQSLTLSCRKRDSYCLLLDGYYHLTNIAKTLILICKMLNGTLKVNYTEN